MGSFGASHQYGSDDQVGGSQRLLKVVGRTVERLHSALEGVVEPAQAMQVDVEDRDIGPHSHGHTDGIQADDPAANDDHIAGCDSGNTAEQYAAPAADPLEASRTGLHAEATGDFGHRGQQWQRPVRILDGFVGDADDARVEKGIGLRAVGGEVQIGVQDLERKVSGTIFHQQNLG